MEVSISFCLVNWKNFNMEKYVLLVWSNTEGDVEAYLIPRNQLDGNDIEVLELANGKWIGSWNDDQAIIVSVYISDPEYKNDFEEKGASKWNQFKTNFPIDLDGSNKTIIAVYKSGIIP